MDVGDEWTSKADGRQRWMDVREEIGSECADRWMEGSVPIPGFNLVATVPSRNATGMGTSASSQCLMWVLVANLFSR